MNIRTVCGLTVLLFAGQLAAAPVLGQVDDFEDGSVMNWIVGAGPMGAVSPVPPTNVSSGGPGGVDDNYLYLQSLGGAGAGSRLTAQNFVQWTGDYLTSGVGSVRMDVRNLGTTDLSLRLLVLELGMMGPVNGAFSTDAIFVPAGQDWTTVVFPLVPDALTSFVGSTTAALSNVSELRIFHNVAAAFPPPAVVAELGVDNITAAQAIPEPGSVLLGAAGLLALYAARRLRG
jgi:hypothetical protein